MPYKITIERLTQEAVTAVIQGKLSFLLPGEQTEDATLLQIKPTWPPDENINPEEEAKSSLKKAEQ